MQEAPPQAERLAVARCISSQPAIVHEQDPRPFRPCHRAPEPRWRIRACGKRN